MFSNSCNCMQLHRKTHLDCSQYVQPHIFFTRIRRTSNKTLNLLDNKWIK